MYDSVVLTFSKGDSDYALDIFEHAVESAFGKG
jgi:hypothetical protein